MAQNLFRLLHRLQDDAGVVEPGASVLVYLAGSSTPVTLYTDRALTITAGSSVTASATGVVPERWLPDGVEVKLVYTDAAGAIKYTRDYFNTSIVAAMISDFETAVQTVVTAMMTTITGWTETLLGIKTFGPDATLSQVNDAISAANNGIGPRTLQFRAGHYQWSGAFSAVTGNNITIRGAGDYNGGTIFEFLSAATDDVTLTGSHGCVRDIWFACYTGRKTGGYSLLFGAGGFRNKAQDVRFDYVWNAMRVFGATETRLKGTIQFRYLLGSRGLQFDGDASHSSYRLLVEDVTADNPLPGASPAPSNIKTWATSTAYTAGDMTKVNGRVYQCTTSGVSAPAGSGPSGIPGTTGLNAFSTEVVDGTAGWKFVYDGDLKWIVQDNYAYSLEVAAAALIGGYSGFVMADTAATGTSYPTFALFYDLEVDHPFDVGVNLDRGEGAWFQNPWISSSLREAGMVFGANYRGEIKAAGGRIYGCAKQGILHNAGPVDVAVSGMFIGDNSVLTANTYDGVAIAANANDFSYNDNRIGDSPSVAGNGQRYGVIVNAGTSARYTITGNDLSGNTTGGLSDAGSGAKVVDDNTGYVSRANGVASILNGTTTITVTHGLNVTPDPEDIQLTPTTTWGSAAKFWLGATSSTQFVINCDANPGATFSFAWSIDKTR